MTLMDELFMESVVFDHRSDLREVCIAISRALQSAYADHLDDHEGLRLSLSDVLTEATGTLQRATGIDVTLKLDAPPNKKAIGRAYSVEVQIPKSGLTPSSMYPKLSDRQMGAIIKGTVRDTVLGEMDYKKRQVSGYYSTIPFQIRYGVDLFRPDFLSEEECAAILLHELGHIWDFLENLGEVSRVMAIASYTKKTLGGNYAIQKKLDLVEVLDPGLAKDVTDPGELGEEEILTLVSSHAFSRQKSSQNTRVYEKLSEEYLADSFAAMHGLGYATATAMEKLEKEKLLVFRHKEYRPVWTGTFKVIGEMLEGGQAGQLLVQGSTLGFFFWTLGIPILTNALPLMGNNVKINPSDRLKKMREALISALREPGLEASEKDAILGDIKRLDKEIDRIDLDLTSLFDTIRSFFTDVFMTKDKRHYLTRMNLDSLDNNRLFALSETLKRI